VPFAPLLLSVNNSAAANGTPSAASKYRLFYEKLLAYDPLDYRAINQHNNPSTTTVSVAQTSFATQVEVGEVEEV
jgi:hypothetical protein